MATAIVPFEKSYFFTTSSPSADAIVSQDGSTLSVTLNSPGIEVPAAGLSATFEVESASIWNTSANISVKKNNNVFSYLIDGVQQPDIVIEDGLYSLSSLNDFISREFVNAGRVANLIQFVGDSSTQKVVATFEPKVQADFTASNSVGSIMGFDQRLVPAVPQNTNGYSESSDNTAQFNNVNSFTIRSDLVSHGVPINATGINLLAVIPITPGSTGKQVVYSPNHPTKVDASDMRGKSKQTFSLSICDQNGDVLPQTEDWSVLIVLRYVLLMTDTPVPMMDL